MLSTDPQATTLALLAHGSPDPRHAAATAALASRLPGAVAGYLAHGPSLVDALDTAPGRAGSLVPGPGAHVGATATGTDSGTGPVVVVPLLLSRAHHARVDVPAAVAQLGRARPAQRVRQADPIGPDPGLLDGLEAQLTARSFARRSDRGVVLAIAGTKDAAADAATSDLAARWQRRGWAGIAVASLGGHGPDLPSAVARLRRAGCAEVAVAAWLLTPGVLLDRARQQARGTGVEVVTDGLWQTAALAALIAARATTAVDVPPASPVASASRARHRTGVQPSSIRQIASPMT